MTAAGPTREESVSIVANGVRMHVRMAGTGYPLILLHGWPQTSYCWRKLMPLLAPHFRLIAPDLRGFGDSDKPDGPYDKRTIATDILAMAHVLGYDNALVAGHDIGGRVAYRLTLDHPHFVKGLISLAGRYSPLGEGLLFSKEQSAERWYFFFHQIEGLPEALVSGRESIYLEHFYKHWSYRADWLSEEDLAEYSRAYATPGALRGGFEHYRAALGADVDQWKQDAGKQIDTPTLVLWGRDDPVSPVAWTDGFDKVFTQLDMVHYPECGHFIAEEHPQSAAHDILRFARKLLPVTQVPSQG
jgi:haloacetate dehalogenase